MAQPTRVPAGKPAPKKEAEAEAPQSRLSWLLGWVIVPGLLFGLLMLAGVYVGANHPDSWVTRAILWIAGWFVG